MNRLKQWEEAYRNELTRNQNNIALMGELLKRLKSNVDATTAFVKLQINGRVEINKHLIYMPYNEPKKTKLVPVLFEWFEVEELNYNIKGASYSYQFKSGQLFRLHKAIIKLLPNSTNTKKHVKMETKANNGLRLVKYSEKAYALFGPTKPLKEKLMEIGGAYCPCLKDNGEISKGWVFSKKRYETTILKEQLAEIINA